MTATAKFLSVKVKGKRTDFVFGSDYLREYTCSKSSSDYILSHLNERCPVIIILSKFDCLVLAHLISNTPRDFIWEIINLSNCDID